MNVLHNQTLRSNTYKTKSKMDARLKMPGNKGFQRISSARNHCKMQ